MRKLQTGKGADFPEVKMTQDETADDLVVVDLILNCLEQSTFLTLKQLAYKMGTIAQTKSRTPWVEGTLTYHLKRLMKSGKVSEQEKGYFIHRGWKEGQPKAFVLVEIAKPREMKKNYPKEFFDDIRDSFNQGMHQGVNLISVDVVMGVHFSAIVQVYSDDLHFIGRFVKEYLLPHPLVTNTQTIMVWPPESRPPASIP